MSILDIKSSVKFKTITTMRTPVLAIGIAVLIIQIACVNKTNADRNENIQECLKSNGLPSGYLEKLKEEDIDNKTLCFAKCVMKKKELFDDNGKLKMENVNKDIDSHKKASEEAKKVARNCMGLINKISSCEDTLKYKACLSSVFCSEK
ncbi:unnamed protein product [Diabrotica balteata]|uniref:Uncharacterized protein n=1 Tax=Diabrotica balteata TaxID=107213 RepID=A0A9N9SZD8_DIABA|nr:unnamed protein product [Diabrotica balteata]